MRWLLATGVVIVAFAVAAVVLAWVKYDELTRETDWRSEH